MLKKSTPATRLSSSKKIKSSTFILVGASTGGTEAIKCVLQGLPASSPPVLLVQHMPEMFTGSFAKRLDGLSEIRVKEAEDGEIIAPGTAYLAPGHSHLTILSTALSHTCKLLKDPPVNRHRPSVDVLFHSAARLRGIKMVAALLTGMGKDGAAGLLALRKNGAWTIAEDESSCVVFGMPREAAELNAACEILPLHDISAAILAKISSNSLFVKE